LNFVKKTSTMKITSQTTSPKSKKPTNRSPPDLTKVPPHNVLTSGFGRRIHESTPSSPRKNLNIANLRNVSKNSSAASSPNSPQKVSFQTPTPLPPSTKSNNGSFLSPPPTFVPFGIPRPLSAWGSLAPLPKFTAK